MLTVDKIDRPRKEQKERKKPVTERAHTHTHTHTHKKNPVTGFETVNISYLDS